MNDVLYSKIGRDIQLYGCVAVYRDGAQLRRVVVQEVVM